MVHKDSTYFGPCLWLNAVVDKPTLDPATPCNHLPPAAKEHLTFEPAVLSLFPPPPCPSPDEGEELTNENLLKSIGFLPGSNHSSFPPEVPAVYQDSCDKTPPLSSSSTDQLVKTFEMIYNPSFSAGDEPHPQGVVSDYSVDDFVVIVPDCFNLSKPLPGFSPSPGSFCDFEDAFVLDPNTTSCDSHVSVSMPPQGGTDSFKSTAASASSEHIIVASVPDHIAPSAVTSTSDDFEVVNVSCDTSAVADVSTQKPSEGEPTGEPLTQSVDDSTTPTVTPTSSPPTAHRGINHRSRFSLRNLKKGGHYRNPLTMATGLMDAVSGYVSEKVHFATTAGEGASEGASKGERRPCMQFSCDYEVSSESSDDDEEFQVRKKN